MTQHLQQITDHSVGLLRTLYRQAGLKPHFYNEQRLKRVIVHKSPHLDEYVADWLLMACLKDNPSSFGYLEQSLFSLTNDHVAESLWPSSVLIGFGAREHRLPRPLHFYDEHLIDGKRKTRSAARLVYNDFFGNSSQSTPLGVRLLLQENDLIDSQGGGHSLHLGNLIKLLHTSRLLIKRGDLAGNEQMPAMWKRAVVFGCLASMAFLITESGRWIDNGVVMKETLGRIAEKLRKSEAAATVPKDSLTQFLGYISNWPEMCKSWIPNGPKNKIAQNLVVCRIAQAVSYCFPRDTGDFILLSLLEPALHQKGEFDMIVPIVRTAVDSQDGHARSHLGEVRFLRSSGRDGLPIFAFKTFGSLSAANAPVRKVLQDKFGGRGVTFLTNASLGTSVVTVGKELDVKVSNRIFQCIKETEPELWYRPEGAHFIVNGNDAHRYLRPTAMTPEGLAEIVSRSNQ